MYHSIGAIGAVAMVTGRFVLPPSVQLPVLPAAVGHTQTDIYFVRSGSS